VSASDVTAATLDGTLTLPAGGLFVALLALDANVYGASMVSDFAWVDGERPGAPTRASSPSSR